MWNRRLGAMVAAKIMTVMVFVFMQRAGHPSLHGDASEGSRCGGVVGGTLVMGSKRIKAVWQR
jgi:hypothetical protein